ncbi:MAG: ABC transporter permease [Bacteroidales bacterium]
MSMNNITNNTPPPIDNIHVIARQKRDGILINIIRHPKARVGVVILAFFVLIAVLGPILSPGDPLAFVDNPNLPPSANHWLGTSGQGQDMFKQVVQGTRVSLMVGFLVGILATVFGTLVGMSSAYFGGRVDDFLSLFTNIFLIIPGLPLLVALAAFLPRGPVTIVLVLAFTGWAGTARVLRSQTLALREKDFVSAALASGENHLRIILVEILPNMASIVASSLFGAINYGIAAQASLEFLGLGNLSKVSWGTILYWAGNNAGLLTGAWWTFVPAGLCIALVAFSLTMLNFAIDEITNPRLKNQKGFYQRLKKNFRSSRLSTPILSDHE